MGIWAKKKTQTNKPNLQQPLAAWREPRGSPGRWAAAGRDRRPRRTTKTPTGTATPAGARLGTCPAAGPQAGTGSGGTPGQGWHSPGAAGWPSTIASPVPNTGGTAHHASPKRGYASHPALSSPSPGIFTLAPFPSLIGPRGAKEQDLQRDAGSFQ